MSPVATNIKKKPRKTRRHVSCFLSNGCERPPHAPAHRQQQTHRLYRKIIVKIRPLNMCNVFSIL